MNDAWHFTGASFEHLGDTIALAFEESAALHGEAPSVQMRRLTEPDRLVLDIQPAQTDTARTISLAHPLARRLRAANHSKKPGTLRLILDLTQPAFAGNLVSDTAKRGSTIWHLRLQANAGAFSALAPPALEPLALAVLRQEAPEVAPPSSQAEPAPIAATSMQPRQTQVPPPAVSSSPPPTSASPSLANPLRPLANPAPTSKQSDSKRPATWLVLKNGQRLELREPWEQKGRLAVYRTRRGILASIRLTEVDLERSLSQSPERP